MPRRDGRPLLPIDMPPSSRASHAGPLVQGIHTSGFQGELYFPLYSVPFNPTESHTFPNYEGSNAAATVDRSGILPMGKGPVNGLRPKVVVSINAYSPVSHRNPLVQAVPPRALPAAGIGKPTQRPRGFAVRFATRWPQSAPRWPSWAEAPKARRG